MGIIQQLLDNPLTMIEVKLLLLSRLSFLCSNSCLLSTSSFCASLVFVNELLINSAVKKFISLSESDSFLLARVNKFGLIIDSFDC